MTELFGEVLRRYGAPVGLEHGGAEAQVLAFVQPVRRAEALPRAAGPLGIVDEGLWLYLGQGPIEAGDTVTWQGAAYAVRSAEAARVGDRLSHWWAVLVRKRVAA